MPGSDKIRVILLQNDLTVPVYDVRLQMTIEWNGSVIMRTSPNFQPRPITLNAGVPNLISGDDLCIYLHTDAIDFTGYSRENYERTKALPEGAYKISFTAYDYRRQNVQVSNVGSNIFFLQKKSPPLLNSPICNSRVQKTDPQFIIFNWSSVNTPSLPGSETEYTFSLFEIKPKNSNPNYIVKSSRPIFTTVIESNTFQYTPGEPALLDSMEYVWTVQVRSKDGRDLYANQGYSIPCKFTYGGIDPFAVRYIGKPSVFANPIHEKAAKVWWAPARETENVELYRIEYRGSTNSLGEFPWHTEERATDTTLTVYPLEPDREYDVRMRYKVSGVYGPYSEIIKFKTPPHKVVECGQPPNPLPLSTNTTPLPSASVGTIVRIGLFDVILTQVNGENGTYSGKGKIVTLGFGFGMALQFKDIFINADKVVTRGDMYSEGDSMDKYVDEKIDRQHKVEAFKKFADKIPDANTPLPELQEFAKALTEIPQDRIDNAIALNREEKQQINDARSKANGALKILNNPQATNNEKKEAEKNLRQAVADAKPALNKLANTLDKGIITVVSQWFKKVMDFLNAYKGNESDKKQAIVWHSKMDSTVNALSKHTDVPANLMKAMLDAHQNAKPAWTSLEKGTDGIRPKGPSADFEEGHTPEDIVLCKTNVETAEAVEKYSISGMREVTDTKMLSVDARAQLYWNAPYWKRAAYLLKEHFESQAQFKNVRMNCSENSCEIIGDVTETGTVNYQVYVTFSSSMTKAEVYAILNDWKVDPYNADIELAETFTQWYKSFIRKREHLIANNEGFEVGFANLLADVLMAAPGTIEGWMTGKHWRNKEELALWQHALGILDVVPGEVWAKVGITALVIRIGSKAINISKLSIPLQQIIQAALKAKLKVTVIANDVIVIFSKSNVEICRIENGKLIPKKVLTSSDEILSEATDGYQLARKGEEVGVVKAGEIVSAGSKLEDIVASLKSEFPSTWKFNKVGDDAFEVLDGSRKKWATIYQDKIVASGRTAVGESGNPILNKATHVKNMKYDVDGIIYQTDDLGRVLKTNADLDDIARVRLGNQQIRAVDVKDGVRGVDQGGHIVGSRFFGPGEQINLFPMSSNLNLSEWKAMENGWAKAMIKGKDVKIEVNAIYNSTSKRPNRFRVIQEIGGEETIFNFIND